MRSIVVITVKLLSLNGILAKPLQSEANESMSFNSYAPQEAIVCEVLTAQKHHKWLEIRVYILSFSSATSKVVFVCFVAMNAALIFTDTLDCYFCLLATINDAVVKFVFEIFKVVTKISKLFFVVHSHDAQLTHSTLSRGLINVPPLS